MDEYGDGADASRESSGPTRHRKWPWLAATAAIVVVALVAYVARDLQNINRPLPEFASLAENPDPTLTGTVAYYESTTVCVRVVDASGGASRDAYCLDPIPSSDGPVTGPHLAWREDGRLEVTAFSWPPEEEMTGAWQRLIDVRTGEVEDVPLEEVPGSPTPSPIPAVAVGPDGEELVAEVRDDRLVIEVTDNGTMRTLLESEPGPSHSYSVGNGQQPMWSPNGEYVVLSDGRLLLTTVGDPSTTRILVEYGGEEGVDPEVGVEDGFGCCWASDSIRRFAVTDQVLVPSDGA
jgi:hypothetical protein